jgi:predicted nucleic acid-binding protein
VVLLARFRTAQHAITERDEMASYGQPTMATNGQILLSAKVHQRAPVRYLALQCEFARVGLVKRKAPDLIIAAVAIRKGLTLVHSDADFGHIAKVSELKHQWIVPAGFVD